MYGVYSIWLLSLAYFSVECSKLWKCNRGFCQQIDSSSNDVLYQTQELCEMVCNSGLNIWPQPTGTLTSLKNLVNLNSRDINVHYKGSAQTENFLNKTVKYLAQTLEDSSRCSDINYPVDLFLNTSSDNIDLDINTDESYALTIQFTGERISIIVSGVTVYGVRHGLETLFQLIISYKLVENTCIATLSYANITDKPVYPHRGLLLDTARNFLPVESIKKNIDGMASSKLNVLHWHITDSQSFPLESSRLPNMTKYGAYDSEKIYSRDDITDLVEYAKQRGVRIVVEIDGPSHAGNGWQWGPDAGLGNLAVCVNKQPWRSYCIQPPCGQLNPVNPNMYNVMADLYKDINDMFTYNGFFHMGGDEVFIPCWNSSQEIIDYLAGKPLIQKTFLDLWASYQNKMLSTFDSTIGHNKTSIVVWTSHLTEPDVISEYLNKDRYIIQAWLNEANASLVEDLVNLGYRVIISTRDIWYLDHGFWGSTTYSKWQEVYNNILHPNNDDRVLGGEVCMWGELVDDSNIEQRIWPRAAAAAERLWSNPQSSANSARYRFYAQRERLLKRGLKPEVVIPRWCLQNPGECNTYM